MGNRWGNNRNRLLFSWVPKSLWMVTAAMKLKRCLLLGRKATTNLDSILKSRDVTLPTKVRNHSYGFSSSHVWMWELDHKENWTLKNWCFWTVVLEKTLESPLDCKEIQPAYILKEISPEYYWKDWCWRWNSNILATWYEELTHWKRPWCWERLKAGGEGDDRGWDVWVVSLTRWTWVWTSSWSWCWTGRPSMLWSMGSQRVGHDWATELNWFYSH